jgi:hypothetical protein
MHRDERARAGISKTGRTPKTGDRQDHPRRASTPRVPAPSGPAGLGGCGAAPNQRLHRTPGSGARWLGIMSVAPAPVKRGVRLPKAGSPRLPPAEDVSQ